MVRSHAAVRDAAVLSANVCLCCLLCHTLPKIFTYSLWPAAIPQKVYLKQEKWPLRWVPFPDLLTLSSRVSCQESLRNWSPALDAHLTKLTRAYQRCKTTCYTYLSSISSPHVHVCCWHICCFEWLTWHRQETPTEHPATGKDSFLAPPCRSLQHEKRIGLCICTPDLSIFPCVELF